MDFDQDCVRLLEAVESVRKRQKQTTFALGVKGLVLEESFITPDEEKELLQFIDGAAWSSVISRRTQHYGFFYDYTKVKDAEKTTDIPVCFDFVINRLLERQLIHTRPDQVIVNEYLPGQGIYAHIDHVKQFCDGIVSISLNSDIMMQFSLKEKKDLWLPRCSALILHDDARYKWRDMVLFNAKAMPEFQGVVVCQLHLEK